MKKTSLKILFVILTISALMLLNPIKVSAVLQSNGGTSTLKKVDDWIVAIRKMEATGGTLGLNETINTTGLLATTESNGLDCHMQKNTEYGAMVLLSASSYGNPSKIASGGTTTGNATGVVMNINREWVAAGAGLTSTTYFKNANVRYVNNDYGTKKGGKYHIGDAMAQGDWHGTSPASSWLNDTKARGLLRGYGGSVFAYCGNDSNSGVYGFVDSYYVNKWSSRAVITIGEGL